MMTVYDSDHSVVTNSAMSLATKPLRRMLPYIMSSVGLFKLRKDIPVSIDGVPYKEIGYQRPGLPMVPQTRNRSVQVIHLFF